MWFMVVYKNNNIPLGIQQVQQQYAMTNKDICCDAYARNKIGMCLMRCGCDKKCGVRDKEKNASFSREGRNRPYGEGITAANSLPGENQSLADLNLLFVVRLRIPIMFFS